MRFDLGSVTRIFILRSFRICIPVGLHFSAFAGALLC